MCRIKKRVAMLIVVLLLIPTLSFPAEAAESKKMLQFQNLPLSIQLPKRPLSEELLIRFLLGKGDTAYWEEDVPDHIKEEIFSNEKIQEKLQYVLERARSAGSWKVVYIFDKETPTYYDSDTFNEEPILDSAGLVFTSSDMSTAVGHINGRLVIGADYLGNNDFSVWLSLTDLYDFDFSSDDGAVGVVANVMAFLQHTDILQLLRLAKPFTLTIGFTSPYTWMPSTQSVPATSNTANAQPSTPVTQPPVSQQTNASQFYARGNYDIGDYTGDMLQGKPHGYGTLEYSSQTKYEIGMPSGSWFKATKYMGYWVNGIRCGQGTFTFANGVQYEGVWNSDGYYFKGYVKSGNLRQYIEQTASGDTITTVYSGTVERIK